LAEYVFRGGNLNATVERVEELKSIRRGGISLGGWRYDHPEQKM